MFCKVATIIEAIVIVAILGFFGSQLSSATRKNAELRMELISWQSELQWKLVLAKATGAGSRLDKLGPADIGRLLDVCR